MSTQSGFNPNNHNNELSESPSILKRDLLKIKSENARLKNCLSTKENEISILKSQIKKSGPGFQMIKINSDNTHIDLDMSIGKKQTYTPNNKILSNSVYENSKHNTLKEHNFSIIKEEAGSMNFISENKAKDDVKSKEITSYSQSKYKEKIPSLQQYNIASRNKQGNDIIKLNSISASKSVVNLNESQLEFNRSKKIKYTLNKGKIVLPRIPKGNFSQSQSIENYDEKRSFESENQTEYHPSQTNLHSLQTKISSIERGDNYMEDKILELKKENMKLHNKINEMNASFLKNINELSGIIQDYEKRNKLLTKDLNYAISNLNSLQMISFRQKEIILNFNKEKTQLENKYKETIVSIQNSFKVIVSKYKDAIAQLNEKEKFIIKANSSDTPDNKSTLSYVPIVSKNENIINAKGKLRKAIKNALQDDDMKRESAQNYNMKKELEIQSFAELKNYEVDGIKISFNKIDNVDINYSNPFYFPSGEPETNMENYIPPVIIRKTVTEDDNLVDEVITKKVKENNFEAVEEIFDIIQIKQAKRNKTESFKTK